MVVGCICSDSCLCEKQGDMNRMGFKGAFSFAVGCSQAHTDSADGPWVSIPFSLHPDYDRRPRDHTGSADLVDRRPRPWGSSSARGLDALRAITAGGELHPALRTLPPEPWRRRVFNMVFQKLHDCRIDSLYRFV